MLVIRDWLTTYDERRDRLRHLAALAPAIFGSPIAHKERSWLGALFKGRSEIGPDFLEGGNRILDALELGSRFTWDLAHRDLIGDEATYGPTYGPTRSTPFAFVLIGAEGYTGLKKLIGEPGTDGVVRWSGCSLNTRKIIIDLTRDPARARRRPNVHRPVEQRGRADDPARRPRSRFHPLGAERAGAVIRARRARSEQRRRLRVVAEARDSRDR